MSWRISVELTSEATSKVSGSYQIDNVDDLETFIFDLEAINKFLLSEDYVHRQSSKGRTEQAAT
jgi:hypothetical protein